MESPLEKYPAMLSPPLEHGQQPFVVCLDIDNTTVNADSKLNLPLLLAMRRFGLTCVILFTAYDIFYRLKTSVEHNYARIDIIRRLQHLGFTVEAVVVSASPYKEPPTLLGSYYHTAIAPIERAAKQIVLNASLSLPLDQLLEAAGTSLVSAKQEVAEIEAAIQQPFATIPVWKEEPYQGGKQHLLTHVVNACRLQERTHFIILDDKPSVQAVVQRAADERTYGDDVRLFGLPVHFSQVLADESGYYERFFEQCYEKCGFTLPLASSSTSNQLHGLIHAEDMPALVSLSPAYLQQWSTIHVMTTDKTTILDQHALVYRYIPGLTSHFTWHLISDAVSWLEEWSKVTHSLLKQGPEVLWQPIFLTTPPPLHYLERLAEERPHDSLCQSTLLAYQRYLKAQECLRSLQISSVWKQLSSFFHSGTPFSERLLAYHQWLTLPQPLLQRIMLLHAWFSLPEDKKLLQPLAQAWGFKEIAPAKAELVYLLGELVNHLPLFKAQLTECNQALVQSLKEKKLMPFDWASFWTSLLPSMTSSSTATPISSSS